MSTTSSKTDRVDVYTRVTSHIVAALEQGDATLLRADFAIVPCKASTLEVRALAKATEFLRQAQDRPLSRG